MFIIPYSNMLVNYWALTTLDWWEYATSEDIVACEEQLTTFAY